VVQGEWLDDDRLTAILDEDDFWEKMDCAKEFFDRSWFSRAWTFQEICLSQDAVLICGEDGVPWSTFHKALRVFWLMKGLGNYERKCKLADH
jgi:hypothetical protein